MKKTLRKILTAGLTSLALAGCVQKPRSQPIETFNGTFRGNFRGYETIIENFNGGSQITMIVPGFYWNRLNGYDLDGDENFDEVFLGRFSTDSLTDDLEQANNSPSPLEDYSSQDSLRLARNEVLEQNRGYHR